MEKYVSSFTFGIECGSFMLEKLIIHCFLLHLVIKFTDFWIEIHVANLLFEIFYVQSGL